MSLTYVLRRHLQLDVAQINGPQTSKQLADLEDRRTSLRSRIQLWHQAQIVHTPCVAPFIAQSLTDFSHNDSSLSMEPAESIPLHLPSSLPQRFRQLPELASVLENECRLCIAQADNALAEIRRQRQIISGLWQFKKHNVDGTGNRTCTRMRALYNRFQLRTQRYAECYRAARSALLLLDSDGDWQLRLRDLCDRDIRGPGKEDDGSGNGRYKPSWIWLVARGPSAPDMGDSEQVLNDSLQVEWAKTQARKQHWEEEVLLVQEEMRRVVMFHEWKAQWWRSQAVRRSDVDASVFHGILAYAEKQAHFCECLARSCVASWLPVLKGNGPAKDWKARYSMPLVPDISCALTDDTGVDYDGECGEELLVSEEEFGYYDDGDTETS